MFETQFYRGKQDLNKYQELIAENEELRNQLYDAEVINSSENR